MSEMSDEIKFESLDQQGTTSPRIAECHLRKVVHILQHPGCLPKPIPSYACYGTCSSFVQVSSSKFWQLERSCNCCQEIGEREATISLMCPKQQPKLRKVTTRAPRDCICRPCSFPRDVEPQEEK
ncbi:hypothetical protein BLOT_001677 [Blomia tropicalis]|nr:hypothetical protein BLOT_001677 [Blomia tropicalis]